jgi:hypothetical protein
MINPDFYLELKSGIKIPVIRVKDFEGLPLNVAPSETLKLLQNGLGEIETEEGREIDNQIFYYAETFERTALLLFEIKNSTDIEVTF